MAAQFAVFANPGRNCGPILFVVVVQCNRFTESKRRVVVPLITAASFGRNDTDVGPRFVIDDAVVIMDPLQITNVPAGSLGSPVCSLAADEQRLMKSLDALLSGAWR